MNAPLITAVPRPGQMVQFAKARLLAPEVDIERIHAVLAEYDLDLTGPVENLPFGWRNRNVVVHTQAGKKVLKRYRTTWDPAAVEHEHSILQELARDGFPAPRLNVDGLGRTLIPYANEHYALFDYATGTNYAASIMPRSQRRQLSALAGQTLAQFHRQLADFTPAGEHHLGFSAAGLGRQRDLIWHLNSLADSCRQAEALTEPSLQAGAQALLANQHRIANTLTQLDQQLHAANLPQVIIHGDYGIHNLLFQRSGSVLVHDFELARREWRLIDLIIVLSRLKPDLARAFMSTYLASSPLTRDEWQLLPQLWQYYRLRGAIQYWHTYLTQGGTYRIAAAQKRIAEADWASTQRPEQMQARYAPDSRTAPLRVMMVVRLFYPWVGGTERQAHKLAQTLVNHGADVQISTGWWFRATPQRETIDGIPLFRNQTLWECFGIKGLRKFGGYLYITTLIWHLWRQRNRYDLIHVHGLKYHTFAAVLAGRWFNKPVVTKLANSGSASDIKKMQRNEQLALSRFMLPTALQSDRFVALNQQVIAELLAAGVPRARIVALPNGVETNALPVKTAYALHAPARLLFVGRLHPQKGLDTLLTAVAQLTSSPDLPPIHLSILGDGPLRMELEQQVEALGIGNNVTFVGQTDNVNPYLEETDLFILPSRAEGISNALLEAMAPGLPVLVSDVAGNSDVIHHDQNGYLFAVDDAQSLAQKLQTLLTNPALRSRLGQAARQTVLRHYSLDQVAERTLTLYQELLVSRTNSVAHPAKQEI